MTRKMKQFLKLSIYSALAAFILVCCNSGNMKGQQNSDVDPRSNEKEQQLLEKGFEKSPLSKDSTYKKETLKFIAASNKQDLYCSVEGESSELSILKYSPTDEEWQTIFPREFSEDEIPYFGLEDFRMKNNRLYCKFFTGQGGLGLEAIAFEYFDINEEKWHFLTYGTEASEFVGDSIEARISWIVKQGENGFDTEVADSIKWIKM